MHPVQKHLFDTNFKDLAGSSLQGTIAVTDELVNLGIMDFINGLQGARSAPATAATSPDSALPTESGLADASPAAAPELPDPKALLAHVDIKVLKLRAEQGRLLLDVDVAMK